MNKRNFSWRYTDDPYKILIAEILLRRTTSTQVNSVYEKFMEKYYEPLSIINIPLDKLENDLKPLGIYHIKAVQLKQMANILLSKHKNSVPNSEKELLELPGVNKYISNAVLCFAYNKKVPIVDTNIARIYSRIYYKEEKSNNNIDFNLWKVARLHLPQIRYKDYNLALLDLGSKICKVKHPLCNICPVIQFCGYHRERQ